jgi:putative transposase
MAESIIGLFKTELIRRRGPWRGPDAVEIATLEWVDWYNNRRLFHALGNIPPAEAETAYYNPTTPSETTQKAQPSLTKLNMTRCRGLTRPVRAGRTCPRCLRRVL